MEALELFPDIGKAYACSTERWAAKAANAEMMRRVALPYSLKQLSEWLARGGVALGAAPPCACTGVYCAVF